MLEPPVSFMGPPTWACFGAKYVTLTSGGTKEEGQEYPHPWFDTAEQAMAALYEQIDRYAESLPATQVAWRRLPQSRRLPNGQFVASARLVGFSR